MRRLHGRFVRATTHGPHAYRAFTERFVAMLQWRDLAKRPLQLSPYSWSIDMRDGKVIDQHRLRFYGDWTSALVA
jgi:hypothetical protein